MPEALPFADDPAYRAFMDSGNTYWNDRALLEWQVELGATDAICDAPVDRYALEAAKPKAKPAAAKSGPPPIVVAPEVDAPAEARKLAQTAADLPALAAAMQKFTHCELKLGARSFVFADGAPAARILVVSDPPDREEDRAGKPMVARAGELFDRMFDAIGMGRAKDDPAKSLYVVPVIPWRPPSDRAPSSAELAMLKPFLEQHIALADPDVLVLMGNTPCQLLLGRTGVSRLRGTWAEALGKPCLPMFHPSFLLRNPAAKREAWADLLALQARMRE